MRFRTRHRRPRNTALSLDVRKNLRTIFRRPCEVRVVTALGGHPPVGASEALEIERNEFLEQLKSFDKKRSHLKASGRRNPSFAKG